MQLPLSLPLSLSLCLSLCVLLSLLLMHASTRTHKHTSMHTQQQMAWCRGRQQNKMAEYIKRTILQTKSITFLDLDSHLPSSLSPPRQILCPVQHALFERICTYLYRICVYKFAQPACDEISAVDAILPCNNVTVHLMLVSRKCSGFWNWL